jgi:hypothetical protein
MKRLTGLALLVCAYAALVFAQMIPIFAETQTPHAAASAKGPGASQAIQQLEHLWLDAAKAGDSDTVSPILADDWVGIDSGGETATKKSYLADVKAGKFVSTNTLTEFGPMDVKLLESVAVVQGTYVVKSTATDGKDSGHKYGWMDVFMKRDGKWVVVRSQLAPW